VEQTTVDYTVIETHARAFFSLNISAVGSVVDDERNYLFQEISHGDNKKHKDLQGRHRG
jgi:hypothetical protein